MARYRKIDVRMYGDEKFCALSSPPPNAKTLSGEAAPGADTACALFGSTTPLPDERLRALYEPSDAYLMTGFDSKTLTLSHRAADPVAMRVEVDISGTGNWQRYRTLDVPAGEAIEHEFPRAFDAYWMRMTCAADCIATAQLVYQ